MSPYQRRVLDDVLDEVQPALAALEIYGPKGVGKTATASRRARTVIELDVLEDRERLVADPRRVYSDLPGPVLLDEWQRLPELWDAVRREVDTGAPRGRFILTGSAPPTGAPVHSGAGRIVGLRMRPLALAERGIEPPTVSLAALLRGDGEIGGATELGLDAYVEEIVASGFPAIRSEPSRIRALRLDGYIDAVIHRELPEQGLVVRRPRTLRAWLAAYAAATSTTASYNSVLDAATPGETDKPAKTTTIAYRDVLHRLWLLDPLDAWIPSRNHSLRLAQAPKHQLADPALAARLLGLDAEALLGSAPPASGAPDGLREGTVLGALFEHLVALNVQVCASASDAVVSHFRSRNGDREVDLIVEGAGGRIVAVEVKLAASVTDRDVRHLVWLRETFPDLVVDTVVVTTGREAYRRRDGVAVVPASLLGP